MSFTLYELNAAYMNVLDLIEDGAEEDVIETVLKNLDDEIENKADSYAIVIKKIESSIDMISEETKRLNAKKRTLSANVDRMKRLLEESMILQDKKKFKTDKFSFNVQKNPLSVKILSEDEISEDFKEIVETVKIDKKAIIKAFKDGEEIKGAEVIQTESLRIRWQFMRSLQKYKLN